MNRFRDKFPAERRRLPQLSRRSLLVGAGAAGGLALAWAIWPRSYAVNIAAAPDESLFNAFLKIAHDGRVIVVVPQCEMGQGVTTLLPQIIADELGADWRTIAVEPAPISPNYANLLLVDGDSGNVTPRALLPDMFTDVRRWTRREYAEREAMMLTGGSSSVRMFEEPCRAAAAQARAMLMMAAAARWDADWQACDTEGGFVTLGEQRLRFGELAAEAADFTPPAQPQYRAGATEPLYGQELTRLDAPAKVDGSMNYAGDVRLPGMVYAAIRQGPVGDTRLKSINKAAGMKSPDLLHYVQTERWLATVARNWWAANRALDRFGPVFETTGKPVSTSSIDAALDTALKSDGWRIEARGDVGAAFAGRRLLGSDYDVAPALHAAIETRTATAARDGSRLRVWVATQAPAQCRAAIAEATGRDAASITLFPMPAGGSFGSALDHSAAVQAAVVAEAIDRPVQLIWSRAEELIRDLPRPPARAHLTASLNRAGGIDALAVKIAVPSVSHEVRERLVGNHRPHAAQVAAAGRSDAGAVGGAMPPYAIPHVSIDHYPADIGLPVGRWRGNSDSYCCFFTESFVDELAKRAETDPLSYRMAMLSGAPDVARCLISATTIGGWEGGVPEAAQGLACHSMRGSHIALMATATMGANGLRVTQLVAAVDCGRIVNPAIARQQIEGGLIFGLAAAVGATTDYRGGVATARKLGQIGLPRLSHCPE
ncbi:MAG: xanthine dehydrogenase family protein molybdopterin-binding subunit, partial [Sphingopyxis sp.]|nr:xanthine dehydrogenase family protein molybdopterin-binding subunit [Sphingopyxis sp.]